MRSWKVLVCLTLLTLTPAAAEEPAAAAPPTAPPTAAPPTEDQPMVLDEVTITVTRDARPTRDVPQAITVIGKEKLEGTTLFNVKDAVMGTPGVLIDSKNGGYDARLVIRGAGLKAPYGIREIMFLRDGVPLTDPDSLTRLDWIDTQDIERIEVSKGPGNLYSPGSAGGAVQIISRSVFDPGANTMKAALGGGGQGDMHLRTSQRFETAGAFAVTASFRMQENDWRAWNRFDSKQVSLKHGLPVGEDATLESEVAYTESNVQLPGGMNEELFAAFVKTGEQQGTSEAWKSSGRYSHILFFNSKLEATTGDLTFKPRVYYNQWKHYHPVTGAINDTRAWTRTAGTDLEAQHRHRLLGLMQGTLVGGLTFKAQWNPDTRKYTYRDVQTGNGGRIVATLSDEEGDLLERGRQENLLGGGFLQESVKLLPWLLLDVGGRLDWTRFDVRTDERGAYDYATGTYVEGDGVTKLEKELWLPAPKVGLTVKATDELSLYASAAQAFQVPSESELGANHDLDPARSTSYEVGAKGRFRWLAFDLAGYVNPVKDEIISVRQDGVTNFQNAGATDKKGVEASASVRPVAGLELGGAYAYSDFTFDSFTERVGAAWEDRSGNRLPFVPVHQWGLFASYRHPSGLRARVQSNAWGRYWTDNANTERYEGYTWLTSAGVSWELGRQTLALEVNNLTDKRYAMQVSKDTSGRVTYTAGAPRTFLVGWEMKL